MSFGRRTQESPSPVPPSPVPPPPAPPPSPPSADGRPTELGVWETQILPEVRAAVAKRIPNSEGRTLDRRELATRIEAIIRAYAQRDKIELESIGLRMLITKLINETIENAKLALAQSFAMYPSAAASAAHAVEVSRARIEETKQQIQPKLMSRLDFGMASGMPRSALAQQLDGLVGEIVIEEKIQLNAVEQRDLVTSLLSDMLGFGPIEPLLEDEKITEILVNGPHRIYVERAGKLELTSVRFRDDGHVLNIATRIVTRIGRRVDESSPICDARLPDGSRVNVIIPPLAIDGPSISIRKFSKRKITLDIMAQQNNLSGKMAALLKIASRSQLNIVISGGTGSGKTTLLNAISQNIDPAERIVTIEDAAELQLQQPHVVRLETRPPNLEGVGEVTIRDLVKNSLRMRPDRIILGEVRGAEAVDMLQAMNTGHEGSLGTIHANRPRETLTRLENMIGLAGINLPSKAVRTQIASALDLIVQIARMRDGVRRITNITEVLGMDGDVIITQELFTYEVDGEQPDGKLAGRFVSSGLRPHFAPKAAYFGLEKALYEAMQ